MEEPDRIVERIEAFFASRQSLRGRKIVITAGPTYEKIDPVRFIGNYSSGKMGFSLARVCAERGADVVLIAGPVTLPTPHASIKRIDVESADEMYRAAMEAYPTADAAICCAAVADYAPAEYRSTKMKRNADNLTLVLRPNKDIAAELGKIKRAGQCLAGFALETDHEAENAVAKMQRKNFDFIVLNSLRDAGAGFRGDTNKVSIWYRDGRSADYPVKSKLEVAADIADALTACLGGE